MNDTSRARKAPDRCAGCWGLRSLMLFAMLLAGCDIVQGFQDAGDTLFPEERTHFNAPGLRLVSGSYRELRFASGDELYLLARSPDGEASALYAMQYANPRPCVLSEVGRYLVSYEPRRTAALIAYFDQHVSQGTLRFANTRCQKFDLEIEDAQLPLGESEGGFVIRAGTRLLRVDPLAGTQELLADGVDQVLRDAFSGRHLLRSAGRIGVFARDWTNLGWFGENVVALGRLRQSLLLEDQAGIFRITPSSADANRLERFPIAPLGCALGIRSDSFATYHAPCGESRLYVYQERTRTSSELLLDAHSRHVDLKPAQDGPGEDPTRDPFWFFYLKDIDPATDLGRLLVRTPSGEQHEIGERAALRNVQLFETEGAPYGYALTDISGATGRLTWWNPKGETRELASGVLRDTQRRIIDFDGVSGRLAIVSGDRLRVIAEGVPADGFEYRDEQGRWTVLFHDFDGSRGRLSLMHQDMNVLDRLSPTRALPTIDLETIAPEVPYYGAALLSRVLPGILYFSDYDAERGTGTLEYRNLELRFTALMNGGISDFVVAHDEVIYSVPHGEGAGIWLAQAK